MSASTPAAGTGTSTPTWRHGTARASTTSSSVRACCSISTTAQAAHAITSLAAACRGLLCLEVPTADDREHSIDPSATDLDVHWRTGAWYRKRLARGFTEIGGGLWLSRTSNAVLFELERAP